MTALPSREPERRDDSETYQLPRFEYERVAKLVRYGLSAKRVSEITGVKERFVQNIKSRGLF